MEKKKVNISMLGKFEITVGGEVVLYQLKQSRKTRLFLEYLILKNGREATQSELLDVLWAENESANPSTALRTLLHRYRSLVEQSGIDELKDSIITNRRAYQWNPDLECVVDVFELERLCNEARRGTLSDRERIERYMQVVDLYAGPLLPSSSDEMWVVPKSVYYHDMYLSAVFALIDLLKADEGYDQIVRVSRRALEIDIYDERLNLELMMALVKTGKNREALSQYQFTSDLHYKQLGIQPPEEIRALYKTIIKNDQEMEADIDDIQVGIENEDETKGAFVCEYEIFKDIYQLQRRMIERYNSTMFIALLTISNTYDVPFDPLVLDSIMKKLLDITRLSLRRGDTISRYSSMQYVILLPSINYETGKMVMERVKRVFYNSYVKSSVMLTYKLKPLNVPDNHGFVGKKGGVKQKALES